MSASTPTSYSSSERTGLLPVSQDAVTLADQLSQSVLAQLPSVCSFDCLRSVTGEFFLECFAGHAAFTLAVVMSQVPALRPCEKTRDRRFDVLVGLPSLHDGIGFGILVAMHIETLCQSFTMA